MSKSKTGKVKRSEPDNVTKKTDYYIILGNQHFINGNAWIFFIGKCIFTIGQIAGTHQPSPTQLL